MTTNPTPTRGVPLTLDRERHLRYPIAMLQEKDFFEDLSLAKLLWRGLTHEDPALTQEQVAEMVDLEMLSEVKAAIKRATGGIIDLERLFAAAGVGGANPPPPQAEPSA